MAEEAYEPLSNPVDQFFASATAATGPKETLDAALEHLRQTAVHPDMRDDVMGLFNQWLTKYSFSTGRHEFSGGARDRHQLAFPQVQKLRLGLIADVTDFFVFADVSTLSYEQRIAFLRQAKHAVWGFTGRQADRYVRREMFGFFVRRLETLAQGMNVWDRDNARVVAEAERTTRRFNDALRLLRKGGVISWFDYFRTKQV